jgi:hypothetical protein
MCCDSLSAWQADSELSELVDPTVDRDRSAVLLNNNIIAD